MIRKLCLYMAAMLLVAACDSEDAWDILKTKGEPKVERREVAPFTGITVHNGINVVLEEADEYSATLDGWANLLPKVELTVDSDGMLTIEDRNKFDLVRNPQNKTIVYLRYKEEIKNIIFSGDGVIRNLDTLRTAGIYILCEDASGTVNLTIEAEGVGVVATGRSVADVNLQGTSVWLNITNWGNAPINADGLKTRISSIAHRGTGDLYVNVSKSLNVEMYSIGDIYYKGNPIITLNRTGKGSLYPSPLH